MAAGQLGESLCVSGKEDGGSVGEQGHVLPQQPMKSSACRTMSERRARSASEGAVDRATHRCVLCHVDHLLLHKCCVRLSVNRRHTNDTAERDREALGVCTAASNHSRTDCANIGG